MNVFRPASGDFLKIARRPENKKEVAIGRIFMFGS